MQGEANWIIHNQLGRRNLTAEEKLYLWGKRYGVEKAQGKRTDITSGQNDQKSGGQKTTAEKIAAEYNVGEATIRRAEKFATAVDQVAEKSPEAKQAILSGRVDHQDVPALAEAPADRLTQLAALPEDQQRRAAPRKRGLGPQPQNTPPGLDLLLPPPQKTLAAALWAFAAVFSEGPFWAFGAWTAMFAVLRGS